MAQHREGFGGRRGPGWARRDGCLNLLSQPAVALYERAEASLPAAPFFHRALADPLLLTILENAAAVLGYTLSPRAIH